MRTLLSEMFAQGLLGSIGASPVHEVLSDGCEKVYDVSLMSPEMLAYIEAGGPGSGHFGHSGRGGKVGGSLPGGGGKLLR